jgi:tryptophan-rich sensory protein
MASSFIFLICLLVSIAIPNIFGVSYKYYEQEWYKKLNRPKFAFPDIVFIFIFPVFYILEATGMYILATNNNVTSLVIYGAVYFFSAFLSGIWSRLFFKWKRCDLSLIAFFLELPVSWYFLYLLIGESHWAWLFFLPRILWGLYAIFANIQYFRLNKDFWKSVKKL